MHHVTCHFPCLTAYTGVRVQDDTRYIAFVLHLVSYRCLRSLPESYHDAYFLHHCPALLACLATQRRCLDPGNGEMGHSEMVWQEVWSAMACQSAPALSCHPHRPQLLL